MQVVIEDVVKNNDRIQIKYYSQGLEKYIDDSVIPFYSYGVSIKNVPKSIAVIPFICNILPICFVLDFTISVDELDKEFYDCINDYRKAYQKMIPMIEFKGNVKAKKLVDNKLSNNTLTCLMFSGGIDATSSLVMNEKQISDCVTIWGADVKYNNEDGWTKMYGSVNSIIKKFNKRSQIIRTNMREYINENELTKVVANSNDGWWHGFQHGISLLGAVAPLAFIRGYNKIIIASSFTKEFQPICASDPRTDNCFRFANVTTKHDGFEYDRCKKVENIYKWVNKNDTSLDVHVCWESISGTNCGHCEKCLRSYLNCRAMGYDGTRLGIIPSISMGKIKRFYKNKLSITENKDYALKSISNHLRETYHDKRMPSDIKWLANFDLSAQKNNPYRLLKKIYHKTKSIFNKE